jgi:hypothetical protein
MAYEPTPNQLSILQNAAIDQKFKTYHGGEINPGSLESDGRKQKKLIKDLIASGYVEAFKACINDAQEKYRVTPKVYAEIESEPIDLIAHWAERRHKIFESRRNDSFISLKDMKNENVKWLVENQEKFQWMVVSAVPFRFDHYRNFAENPGDPVAKDRSPWWLATNFEDCVSIRKMAATNFQNVEGYLVCVTSDELKAHVEKRAFDEKIDILYKQNLPWGLVSLNLVSEDEMFYPLKPGEHEKTTRQARIAGDLSQGFGLVGRLAYVDSDPEKWETNLASSIERIESQLEQGKIQLAFLRKLSEAVEHYGWNKFLVDYRTLLIESVRNDEKKKQQS